jgi:hypothetical protein
MGMLRGPLENRTYVILMFFCVVESVWSWLSIKHVQSPPNPASIFGIFNIFFYVLFILALASIAYRSQFWGDRVVFGIVAGVSVLIAIKATIPLTRPSMLAVNVAKSSMWTIAALVSLGVLVRGSNTSLGINPSHTNRERR